MDKAADSIEDADLAAGKMIASRRGHPLVKWIGKVSEAGDQGPLYLMGTAALVAGVLRKDPRGFTAGLATLAAVAGADVLKSTVKRLIRRSRPDQALEDGEYRFEAGGSARKEEQSFPSGHTACTVAAVETAVRYYPGAAIYLRPAAAIMALGRVAKGKHWPLDLVAGLGIGLASAWLVKRVLPGKDWTLPAGSGSHSR